MSPRQRLVSTRRDRQADSYFVSFLAEPIEPLPSPGSGGSGCRTGSSGATGGRCGQVPCSDVAGFPRLGDEVWARSPRRPVIPRLEHAEQVAAAFNVPLARPSARTLARALLQLSGRGGIFTGMIDAEDPLQVMDALGPRVVTGLGRVVAATRKDLALYREAFPEWSAQATSRGTKSWLHDRLFDHVKRELGDMPSVRLKMTEPAREFMVDQRFRFRMKAHLPGDLLSSYPTPSALQFMCQGLQPSFPSLGEIRLVAGYRWDQDLMEMAEAVVTLRDGRRCVWAVELRTESTGGVLGQFAPFPIAPAPGIAIRLPGIERTSDG